MKRHKNLTPLSREHHGTLILAQLLKKGAPAYKDLPALPHTKSIYAKKYFIEHLQSHFDKEEKMLEKVKLYNSEISLLTDEIIQEHQQLKTLFNELNEKSVSEIKLDLLGKALENHIRKEERILFPAIEKYCPAIILDNIEL